MPTQRVEPTTIEAAVVAPAAAAAPAAAPAAPAAAAAADRPPAGPAPVMPDEPPKRYVDAPEARASGTAAHVSFAPPTQRARG